MDCQCNTELFYPWKLCILGSKLQKMNIIFEVCNERIVLSPAFTCDSVWVDFFFFLEEEVLCERFICKIFLRYSEYLGMKKLNFLPS